MPYIRTIPDDEADEALARQYEMARGRSGKVYNIVRVMGLEPRQLDAAMGLYRVIMFGKSPLSRAQRETIAVVVSHANQCHY
jgi:alkylhydroperoxidase family enzyme